MEGVLTIQCIDVDTKKVKSEEVVHNTILQSFYGKLVHFLGADVTGYVDRVQVGVGTQTPLTSDEALQWPITPILDVSAPAYSGSQVTFTAQLQWDQGNGFSISEAGLMTDDDTLVTRVVFSPKAKSTKWIFSFIWTINLKPA